MKKIILTMMACAGLCACTNEEIVGTGGTTAADELSGEVAYITVNIKDVGSSTRADDGGFAYGTADEQKVANAYFYFYDNNGNYMARGSVASVSGTASTGGDTPGNIEWSSPTVVAVYGLTDETLPTRMVTVLNQPSGFSGTHLSLSEMQAALAQATNGYADGNGYFVMSTSSYYNAGVVNYTALTADDFNLEPINLESVTPVDVYVERLAAKVSVTNDIAGATNERYNLTPVVENEFASDMPEGGIYVQLLGWDINGTSRDSYMLKNIDFASDWANSPGFTGWNEASNYRCYWAESPNYGDETHVYPTSSNGNTDTDENTLGLDTYLKYTSLKSPKDFNASGYCAENTNTTTVLGDASSTGITNVLVKAQVVDAEGAPLDLVNFHGMYYTAEDFCQKTVDDVIEYDFTVVVDEVIEALKDNPNFSSYTSYLDALNSAILKEHVYVSEASSNHKWSYNSNPTEISVFDGSLLSLYNIGDGNVDLFFNGAQPYWGAGTEDDPFKAIDDGIIEKYPEEDIVYGGADLDAYDFWFAIDDSKLSTLESIGLTALGIIHQIGSSYYMALDNSYYFTTQSTGDPNFTGNHTYTLRNYLLRAITVEADGIDSEFGTYYPILYNNGMMYYSIPIEHLGVEGRTGIAEGQYGVVRNHWYNISLNSISNLGHGIAYEEEVIVPQPELDYYYLGATVNILSWKMINQTADLK